MPRIMAANTVHKAAKANIHEMNFSTDGSITPWGGMKKAVTPMAMAMPAKIQNGTFSMTLCLMILAMAHVVSTVIGW